jgi:hypothetical protein
MLTKLLKRFGYYPYASVELAHDRGYWAGREDEQYLTAERERFETSHELLAAEWNDTPVW